MDTETPIDTEIVAKLAGDADRLRVAPEELTQLVRVLTSGGSHPRFTRGRVLDPAEIVAVLLHGVARRDRVDD